MVICHCLAINDRMISELRASTISSAPVTVDDVVALCGAGGQCGGCRDSIEKLLDRGPSSTIVELADLRS